MIRTRLQSIGTAVDGAAGARVADALPAVPADLGAGWPAGGGMAVPVLADPAAAFGLPLGQDGDLFGFSPRSRLMAGPFQQFYPPFGRLGVERRGGLDADDDRVDVTTDLTFGCDLYDLIQLTRRPRSRPGRRTTRSPRPFTSSRTARQTPWARPDVDGAGTFGCARG